MAVQKRGWNLAGLATNLPDEEFHGLPDDELSWIVFLCCPPLIGRIATVRLRRICPVRRSFAAGCAIAGGGGCDAGNASAAFHAHAPAKPRRADWRPEARAPKPNFFR